MVFHKLTELVFSWFKIDHDTDLVEQILFEDPSEMFIVKKSKYFITLLSLPQLFAIIAAVTVNAAIFFSTSIFPIELQTVLAIALVANLVLWLISIFQYLAVYTKNYWVFNIMEAKDRLPILRKWDKLFRWFFNQTVLSLIFYFVLIWVFIGATIIYYESISVNEWLILIANWLLFIFQFYLIKKLLGRFINLEMDFTIITKRRIRHTNQLWISLETVTIDQNKVKSINSNKSWMIRSLFNYGEVFVITDWDQTQTSWLALEYVDKPETVENLINNISRL